MCNVWDKCARLRCSQQRCVRSCRKGKDHACKVCRAIFTLFPAKTTFVPCKVRLWKYIYLIFWNIFILRSKNMKDKTSNYIVRKCINANQSLSTLILSTPAPPQLSLLFPSHSFPPSSHFLFLLVSPPPPLAIRPSFPLLPPCFLLFLSSPLFPPPCHSYPSIFIFWFSLLKLSLSRGC